LVEDLYKTAYEYGLIPRELWEMTCKEISEFIKAQEKAKKERLQWDAIVSYRTAYLVGVAVNSMNNYPKKVDICYPGLFEPEKRTIVRMPSKLINYDMSRKKKR